MSAVKGKNPAYKTPPSREILIAHSATAAAAPRFNPSDTPSAEKSGLRDHWSISRARATGSGWLSCHVTGSGRVPVHYEQTAAVCTGAR
jgi:hypothetical protein